LLSLTPLITASPLTGAYRSITSDLLAEVYLAPRFVRVDPMAWLSEPGRPWSASMDVAPAETAAAVLGALRAVALATPNLSPDDIDLSRLAVGSRIYSHLRALQELWREAPELLPGDVSVLRHVLQSSRDDALEALPLVTAAPCRFASPAERRLFDLLLEHHGLAESELRLEWNRRNAPVLSGARSGTSLSRVQNGLLDPVENGPLDSTLSLFSVRDEAEEAAFAAIRARRWITEGVKPSEIALLIPDEARYFAHLRRAFDTVDLPLSGLPELPASRDIVGETLLHLVLCFLEPAPIMAQASLYTSSLMPWSAAEGAGVARSVMKGAKNKAIVNVIEQLSPRLGEVFRRPRDNTSKDLLLALEDACEVLVETPTNSERAGEIRRRASEVRNAIASSPSDRSWDEQSLIGVIGPVASTPSPSEPFIEGVSVLLENRLPSRPVRHMIAMGMGGDRWPRTVGTSALFLAGEIEQMRQATGLQIETRSDTTRRRLEKVRIQFRAATESLILLRPLQDASGAPLSAAPALSYVARSITGPSAESGDVDAILRPWREPEQVAHSQGEEVAGGAVERQKPLPTDGFLRLDRDLLTVRCDREGTPLPQSPSRLETLLVSPLAWTLSEFYADRIVWHPETLDVLIQGTLAHDVLEFMFPSEAPLPDDDSIGANVGQLLSRAINRNAPFLRKPAWAFERARLERELIQSARAWRTILERIGAEVLGNEVLLRGEGLGISIRGVADSLLRLTDGSVLIVDHKRSGSKGRRERMEAGWDLQAGLYREMLLTTGAAPSGAVAEALASGPRIGVAYHSIIDAGVLLEGLELAVPGVTVISCDTSVHARDRLMKRLEEVRQGWVRLNGDEDRSFFEKTAKFTPYALDASPLVSKHLIPAPETSDDMETAHD
jgi:hypothetical protein